MQPTKRAVIDPLRACPLRCDFCYYLHGDMKSQRELEPVLTDLQHAVQRGNEAIDITGGEPLVWKPLKEFVAVALDLNIGVRIISSLQGNLQLIEELCGMGATFLVSLHGHKEETHDDIVNRVGARARQMQALEIINQYTFDCNYVICKKNESEIFDFAEWVTHWYNPRVVNYINFNPHYDWGSHIDAKEVVADPWVVGDELDCAIDYLEANGVGVNVRYFPMCSLSPKNWKNICNDLHVMFDPGEWDSGCEKTFKDHLNMGLRMSNNNEEQGPPCDTCPIKTACGGVNKHYHRICQTVFGRPVLKSPEFTDPPPAFDQFRKDNVLGEVTYHA